MRRSANVLIRAAVVSIALAVPALGQDPTPSPDESPSPAASPAPADTDEADPPPRPILGLSVFPLGEGWTWSYRVRISIEPAGGDEDATPQIHKLEVVSRKPQQVNGQRCAVLEWALDGRIAQRSFFVVEGTAIRCLKRVQGYAEQLKSYDLDPPQTVVRADLREGTTWDWEGKVGDTDGRQAYRVLASEQVTLLGALSETKVSAVVVKIEYSGEDSEGWTKRWYVKDMGIVREETYMKTPHGVFRTEGILESFTKGE